MITQSTWSQAAQNELARAIAQEHIGVVKDQVDAGVAKLWHCKDDHDECYIVTRLEPAPKELCFVCAAGTGALKFGKEFIARADELNIPVRCHVSADKKGIMRLWQRLQFNPSEIVLRRSLKGAS
jgi:hypothetical protein